MLINLDFMHELKKKNKKKKNKKKKQQTNTVEGKYE